MVERFDDMKILRWMSPSCMLIVTVMLLAASGCKESLEPKGPYNQALVVYSIVSNRSDSLFVRVYSTYNPPGVNPLETTADTDIKNALVNMTADSVSYTLSNVVIPRTDKSRYGTDINGYLARPFHYSDGTNCTLTVTSPSGKASASVTLPGSGLVEATNGFILKAPDKYDEDIAARVRLSSVTQGYLLRIYVEFDAVVNTRKVHIRTEIPKAIRSTSETGFVYDYPILQRKMMDPVPVYEVVFFGLDAYKAFLLDQVALYGEIKLTSATFIMTQVEINLYKYYNIANGFLDQYSIRTDLPDYTNINGGYGIFGAMRDDSVVVDLH
ncbi:MAG TPA: DUF4249 family protein [Bacteroidota bacterium]|nr:DUF4249 family protein [Bacteroidota bacterium]